MGNRQSIDNKEKTNQLVNEIMNFECSELDIGDITGQTEYIDFITENMLEGYDVMKGVDIYGRFFIVVKAYVVCTPMNIYNDTSSVANSAQSDIQEQNQEQKQEQKQELPINELNEILPLAAAPNTNIHLCKDLFIANTFTTFFQRYKDENTCWMACGNEGIHLMETEGGMSLIQLELLRDLLYNRSVKIDNSKDARVYRDDIIDIRLGDKIDCLFLQEINSII